MSYYFDTLAPNQEQALGSKCRGAETKRGQPNCPGTYVKRQSAKHGVFVGCSEFPRCRSIVGRPRGRDGGRKGEGEAIDIESPNSPDVTPPTLPIERAPYEPITPEEIPAMANGSIEQAIVASVMPHVNAALKNVQISAEQVNEVVLKHTGKVLDELREKIAALDARQPTRIEIVRGEEPKVEISGAHYLMPRLLRVMNAGLHPYLWGPAGSGKTTALMQAAHGLSLYSEIDTLDPSTVRSMIQGYRTPTGEAVQTSFSRCYAGTPGGLYIADELDNAPGHVQTIYNSALANGHVTLAWGNVAKGEKARFGGAGNTPGLPTREFPDRKPMSAAFKDRLYFMHWPIDASIEARAAGITAPALPKRREATCDPASWGRYVRDLRAWAVTNAPTLMITPRATLAGLTALSAGETPSEVADGLIFRGCDNELRAKACAAVSIPGGEG